MKKAGKIIIRVFAVTAAVLLIIFAAFCIMGRSRYTREIEAVEGDSTINIMEGEWLTKTYLNCYYRVKTAKFIKEARRSESVDVLFLGDSITDFMDASVYYPDVDSLNQGIAGDTTRGVLNRMDLVYEAEPETVVVLIGINDLMNEKRSPENIVVSYEQILTELRTNLPDTRIICQSVYPTYDGYTYQGAAFRDGIIELNGYIRELTEKYGLEYADTYSVLEDGEGYMKPEYCADGVHPLAEGYEVISEYLKKII